MRNVYKMIILPKLDEMIPTIRDLEFTLYDKLNVFTEITNEDLNYTVADPIEVLIYEILQCSEVSMMSLRDVEFDPEYMFDHFQNILYRDAEELLPDGNEEMLHDPRMYDLLNELAEIQVSIAQAFFKYVHKGHRITPVDVQGVFEIIVHDNPEFFIIQYLIHRNDEDGT